MKNRAPLPDIAHLWDAVVVARARLQRLKEIDAWQVRESYRLIDESMRLIRSKLPSEHPWPEALVESRRQRSRATTAAIAAIRVSQRIPEALKLYDAFVADPAHGTADQMEALEAFAFSARDVLDPEDALLQHLRDEIEVPARRLSSKG